MTKRSFIGTIKAGESLIRQAIDATRRYQEAEDAGLPSEEVRQRRLLADSLFEAVLDFQLIEQGRAPSTVH
ncbi:MULTISPECIES: hypothetical protein [unclassified Pseudomonas]|uniref:hypothetical protein n=1 Tax=unclassified Pseudomonas TaxID=196821 RepID=UPI00076211F2|nr:MULTISPECIES: hypothetical protein [unclassified Pseudomonas]MBK4989746.1 hypothetical protein [Pseudomonas sp. S36]